MKKICIYGEHVAEALEGKRIKGGAEIQAAAIARTLAARGIGAAIVDPCVASTYQVSDNLTVHSVPGWNRGIRGIRFFQFRLPGLVRVLRSTEANVFYARGFSFRYLVPLYVARRTNARFVLGVASDTDLLGFKERFGKGHKGKSTLWDWISTIIPDEIAYRLLISLTDVVAVQHDAQERWARHRGKRVVRLNNILEESVFNIPLVPSRRSVIAVGTLSLAKGLRALLPVITISPRVHFEFVGEVLDNEGASVARELRQLPNVTLTGPLGRRETLERIAAAKALVNTSPHEGFPNTFLEAWALGTPVISLYVDPGGVIRRNHLGYVCDGNIQLFQELVQRESYDLDPSSIRTYVASHHSPESAFRVLEPLVSNGREDNGMKTPGQTNNNE